MTSEICAASIFNMDEALEICSLTLKMPLCKHKTETSLFNSRTKMNLGKKFFCCPYWKVDNCGYWKWVEEGSNVFEVGKSVVIEIEKLKKRMELVENLEKENSNLIEIEAKKIKKTKELIEKMGNIRIEMQRIRLGMTELGGKMKANTKWNLLATIICFVLLAYILPSDDYKGMLSLPFSIMEWLMLFYLTMFIHLLCNITNETGLSLNLIIMS